MLRKYPIFHLFPRENSPFRHQGSRSDFAGATSFFDGNAATHGVDACCVLGCEVGAWIRNGSLHLTLLSTSSG